MNSIKNSASRLFVLILGMTLVGGIVLGPADSFAAKKEKKAADQTAQAVDINSADQKTIAALPGIGKKTAKDIIAGRPFKSLDDMKRVKGMTDAKLKSIANKVTFGAAAAAAPAQKAEKPSKAEKPAAASAKLAPGQRVNINTASKDELDKLPGIGPVKAQAIIDNRPFSKPEDIMKVKGIKEKQYEQIRDMITVH